jgi:hypothetical protein
MLEIEAKLVIHRFYQWTILNAPKKYAMYSNGFVSMGDRSSLALLNSLCDSACVMEAANLTAHNRGSVALAALYDQAIMPPERPSFFS